MLSFTDYNVLMESLDRPAGELYRDTQLEPWVQMMLPEKSHDSVRVVYTADMENNGLRLIKFKNKAGHVEYHIHNTGAWPGTSPVMVTPKGFMDTVKIIHDDALGELNAGNKVALQSIEGSSQHAKYTAIAHRLARRSGRKVRDLGIKPISSYPGLKGPMLLIE
jgi:hypothetical protein